MAKNILFFHAFTPFLGQFWKVFFILSFPIVLKSKVQNGLKLLFTKLAVLIITIATYPKLVITETIASFFCVTVFLVSIFPPL